MGVAWPLRVAVALLILAIAVAGTRSSRGLDADRYARTTGKIIEYSRDAIGAVGGYRLPPSTQYRTTAKVRYEVNGNDLQFEINQESPPLNVALGDTVTVFYEKTNPQRAFLNMPQPPNYRLSVIMSLVLVWLLYEVVRGGIQRDTA